MFDHTEHRQQKPFWGISAVIPGEDVTELIQHGVGGEGHTRQPKTHAPQSDSVTGQRYDKQAGVRGSVGTEVGCEMELKK